MYEVDIKQLCSCNIDKYNTSMLSRLSDFVILEKSECGLNIATYKHNYVFSQKNFILV